MRYIIHPRNINQTPRRLWKNLGAVGKKYPNLMEHIWDFSKDLFLIYPKPNQVIGVDEKLYKHIYSFWQGTKYWQRKILEEDKIPVIKSGATLLSAKLLKGNKFIVRPWRHTAGKNYRITDKNTDFLEGQEYISEFFPKVKEYRVIYVYGKPTIYLRKLVPKELSSDEPWNHANGSTFNTVDQGNSLLKHTDIIKRLDNNEILKYSHIVGVDVLLDNKNNYVVCEFNACPSLSIEANLDTVVKAIKEKGTE